MEVAENINEIKEIINSNKGYIYLNWGDRRFNNEITNYISQVKGLVEKVSKQMRHSACCIEFCGIILITLYSINIFNLINYVNF